jgi:hypothetical protein
MAVNLRAFTDKHWARRQHGKTAKVKADKIKASKA